VEISGLIQVGSETQIILKAPNEATSRYVKVGQRLANGQVLVKRVEVNQGAEPVVILEENGIEVEKLVGEKPVTPDAEAPAAATPAPAAPAAATPAPAAPSPPR
jgi:pyruvate/2-oxoglutarate dehydrogenase complex dihydrolipoamide acyltransferase (E2) component